MTSRFLSLAHLRRSPSRLPKEGATHEDAVQFLPRSDRVSSHHVLHHRALFCFPGIVLRSRTSAGACAAGSGVGDVGSRSVFRRFVLLESSLIAQSNAKTPGY